ASASELVINGLNPYITVKSIGTKTVGKYVASIKVYDSKDLGRAGANPNHTYAMQPIVLEELNKLDFNDKDGFDPTILLPEDYGNLGILGDENEPLFKATLDLISTGGKLISAQKELFLEKPFSGSNEQKLKQTMVVDKKINSHQ
ncbi:MAG: peptidase S41, partial [Zetaproteobacteria bacterium]|nr:peptidase S41 [Flavobacteriales bacterium]